MHDKCQTGRARPAYRQMEHTSAGMQEGAASPFLCHPQRQTPLGRLGGPKPSKCNPNPATCAAGSEALRSKVSLHVSPAAPPGAGETCPGGKGRQRRPFSTSRSGCKPLPLSCSARALRAQEHDVPFAARLTEQPCSERPSTCRRSERAVPVFPVSGRRKKFFQNATTLSPSRSF